MKKLYGSLTNRFEEGRNFTGRELQVGDDITMYYYTDRRCYYITNVISEKEIQVKPYYICADHDKEGGQGHQNWLYFKSQREHDEYLNKHFPDHKIRTEEADDTETWVFRNNKWKCKSTINQERINQIKADCGLCLFNAKNEKEAKLLAEGKDIIRYRDLSGKVSFGVRDYYYDWEF